MPKPNKKNTKSSVSKSSIKSLGGNKGGDGGGMIIDPVVCVVDPPQPGKAKRLPVKHKGVGQGIGGGPKIKFMEWSESEFEDKIESYFEIMDEKKWPYTVSGLALHLGCDEDTLSNYENKAEIFMEEGIEKYERYLKFFGALKRAKLAIKNYTERQLFRSSGNVVGAIFSLKNNYGWADKQEIKQTGDSNMNIIISNYNPQSDQKKLQ